MGRETGPNSRYNKENWEFVTRSRVRFSGWKITKKHQGKWRFWLNQPNTILAEGGPGWSDIISGVRQDEETNDQISWVIRC